MAVSINEGLNLDTDIIAVSQTTNTSKWYGLPQPSLGKVVGGGGGGVLEERQERTLGFSVQSMPFLPSALPRT